MYSFLVLGLIPGTTLQITFLVWMDCVLLFVEITGLVWLYRRHPLHAYSFRNAYHHSLESLGNLRNILNVQFNYTVTED